MCNFLHVIFRNFEFSFCFAPPLHGVEENTISDFDLTTDSVKSKRGSGDTPTWRAWLRVLPHGNVVGAATPTF